MANLHCWKDEAEHLADLYGWGTAEYWDAWSKLWPNPDLYVGGTCMLPDGHKEPHEFIRDDKIGVKFVASSIN
jgi:hypothetical protein